MPYCVVVCATFKYLCTCLKCTMGYACHAKKRSTACGKDSEFISRKNSVYGFTEFTQALYILPHLPWGGVNLPAPFVQPAAPSKAPKSFRKRVKKWTKWPLLIAVFGEGFSSKFWLKNSIQTGLFACFQGPSRSPVPPPW